MKLQVLGYAMSSTFRLVNIEIERDTFVHSDILACSLPNMNQPPSFNVCACEPPGRSPSEFGYRQQKRYNGHWTEDSHSSGGLGPHGLVFRHNSCGCPSLASQKH